MNQFNTINDTINTIINNTINTINDITVKKMILDKKSEFNQDFGEDLGRWGPFITYYNLIDNRVEHLPNPGFARLLKANFFKIDNPPTFYLDDSPDIEWDESKQKKVKIPKLNMFLEIKLPIKIDSYGGKVNLSINYLFEMDPVYKNTKKCFYNISHYYVENLKQYNLKPIINEYEDKLEKSRKLLWERKKPSIFKYTQNYDIQNYDKEERNKMRLEQMVIILKKRNHNFLKEKITIPNYEEAISLIETCDMWWLIR